MKLLGQALVLDDWSPYSKVKFDRDRHTRRDEYVKTQGTVPCDYKVVSTSQGMPRMARKHQKLKEARKGLA